MGRSRELAKLATGYDSGGGFGFKNRIINGDCRVDQRNAGATVNTGGAFPVDRFKVFRSGGSATFTAQRSTTAPTNFTNSLLFTVGTGAAPAATDFTAIQQSIEGFNVADLNWGTANAQTITISFVVRSSVTGTYAVALRNDAGNRSYVASYTINAANTFETKTLTIPGDTSGTWLTDNNSGINVAWDLGVGSTYSGSAGSWSGNNFFGLTGGTKLISTSGATFYITGVQLEAGTVASPFERRDYGRELIMCQRYYQNLNNWWEYAQGAVGNINGPLVTFSTPMRSAPTITAISSAGSGNSISGYTVHNRNGVCYAYSISYSSTVTGYGYRQETNALNAEL